MAEKKNVVTYSGLKKIEEELQHLKVNKRREIAAEDQGGKRAGRSVRECRVRCSKG